VSQDRVILRLAGPDLQANQQILQRAADSGFRRFLGPAGVGPLPEGVELFREVEDGIAREDGSRRWSRRSVESPRDLERIRSELAAGTPLLLRFPKERVLPLESLLATEAPRADWIVEVEELESLPAALGALERGASRAIVRVRSLDDLRTIATAVDVPSGGNIEWVLVPVSRVAPAGLGDRVIVDTTSLLRPEEGMLVGSAARLLFHVASEAEGSRFTRPRPFRINAGAAHSYALLADGSTRYLSELEAGDSVLVAVPRGAPRSVRVGRLKIERRPLSLVEATDAGRAATVFVQEAETVRLSSDGGRVPVTDLRPGTAVFAARSPPARHLGAPIVESIEER
jgi:3-dehydroquinate synthase II